jgi:hypothetical protein
MSASRHEPREHPVNGPLDAGGHEVKTEATTLPQLPGDAHAELGSASRTLWGDAWRRLRKNKLAVTSIVWIL